jgi:phosphopentomutase
MLYEMCEKTRPEVYVGQHVVGRIIARPFIGKPGSYSRTQNRRDFSLEPYGKILLDVLFENNIPTIGISSENPFQIKLSPKIIETLNDGDWFYSKNKKGIDLGIQNSFADLGKTIGEMFNPKNSLGNCITFRT